MITRLIAIVILVTSSALGQHFEVASVKPSAPGDPGMYVEWPPGRLSLRNVNLRHTIKVAFLLDDYRIAGGPKWLDDDGFDIEGKTAEAASADQKRAMLQVLLADRFHLQSHRETRMVAGYAVVIAKSGPKLPKPEHPERPSASGWGPTIANGRNQTMEGFAQTLSASLQRPVVDETGIKDRFDFNLRWDAMVAPPVAGAEPGASVFAALQEQLGLKLEARHMPVEILVIDRAEKPSAN